MCDLNLSYCSINTHESRETLTNIMNWTRYWEKLKIERQQRKYHQEYGRPKNSTTYCSDTVMPYIIKTLSTDGWRDASSPFLKRGGGDVGLAKNYRCITLTSIAAKIYNALLHNCIEPKIDNILRKNQNGFRRNRSTTSQILTIRQIFEGVCAKSLEATILFVDFNKAFNSIHKGKMEQILLTDGLPKETVAAIMMLCRNTKVKVRSPGGDTDYFDIVAGVLQGDTLAPYLFIICLDYELWTSIDKIKENGFKVTKERSRRYLAKTITDADYADDIALLENAPAQAETQLHSLERAAASIGFHVNVHKNTCALIKQVTSSHSVAALWN